MTVTTPQPGHPPYPAPRIAMHWLAAALLLLQRLTADAYHRTHGSLLPPRQADLIEYAVHRYAGILLGAAVLLQFFARWRGSPAPATGGGWRRPLAEIVHWGLIATLLGQAVTGVIGVYVAPQAARAHGLLWSALLVLLALHIAGVFFHLLHRDGMVGRILPHRPPARRAAR